NKQDSVSLSKLGPRAYEDLLKYLNFDRKTTEIHVTPVLESVMPFEWDDRPEDQQTENYLQWLKDNISIHDKLQWYNASSDKNFLSIYGTSFLPFSITGTADVAIVRKMY